MSTRLIHVRLGLVLGLLLAGSPAGSAAETSAEDRPRQMMAQGYYFHEPTDRAWQLRIVGEIPSPPGCYYILHDAEGRLLLRWHVPHGVYTEDQPLVIDIPKDGRAGDVRLVILGQQDDLLGPRMPLSNLPFEVYGGRYFTAGANKTPIYFKVEPGATQRNIKGYKGNVRVYDGDRLVVDAKSQGQLDDRFNYSADFPVKPGVVYRIERDCFYFRSDEGLLLTFDPQRWFVPDAKLDTYNWWELSQ